ncbi:alkaline phosphatase D family protein [Planctomycetes bacterium Poly30]
MLQRLLPGVLLLVAAAPGCGVLALAPDAPASTFRSDWHELQDRTWIGEKHWANRLQDWRVAEGTLECVEARPAFGMRTLHLLTHRLVDGKEGSFRSRVQVDAVDGSRAGSAAGFLVGAGGEHVDYRLTSQVHGTSAEDGGFLALLDGDGKVFFADFEQPIEAGGGNQWVMQTNRELVDFGRPATGVTFTGDGFGAAGPVPVELELVGASFDGRRTFILTAREARNGGEVLSTASWEDVPVSAFDGAVALVSHRGPEGADRGYRFAEWTLAGELVASAPERAFGPILFVHYTVDVDADVEPETSGRLGLTAQAGPLGVEDARTATLELAEGSGRFREVAEAKFVPDSATFHFVVEGLDPGREHRFRVRYAPVDEDGDEIAKRVSYYEGVIAAEPDSEELTIASLSCQKSFTGGLRWNESGLWFPHTEVRDHVAAHGPHLLYFAGDQIYEGDLTAPARGSNVPLETSIHDYLHKWYRHGWSFGDLTRRLPTVVVTDDHDVFHGNIWGNAGVRMKGPEGTSAQDSGGYVMSPAFVNAVHRTQVAHLPPTRDSIGTLANGITTYHTELTWGGGSFAILNDRMYKSPPAILVPEGKVKNGWFQAEGFDPAKRADVPGAVLLGQGQEDFLAEWASDRSGAWFKACLSQTPLANVATLPAGASGGSVIPSLAVPLPGEYVEGDERAADTDSNGWPQTPRNRAVALLRRASAFHLTGDQHLGSTLRYGVDDFDDAGFVLSSPAVANTWPRRWFPDPSERQAGPPIATDAPDYTGRYFDGFGNRMTVLAVANPRANGVEPERLHGRAPGYGIVRVTRDSEAAGGGRVTFEAWPRHVDPKAEGAAPFEGWPVRFSLGDGGERRASPERR